MNLLYDIAGVSKQALHQHNTRQMQEHVCETLLLEQADAIRAQHPKEGCRKMGRDLSHSGWGRDKVEALLLNNGYRVFYKPNFIKTTHRQQIYHYDNLIEGMELKSINKVIQTDITYFRVKELFFYLTFMIDVYSRRIVGYAVSKTLEASANLHALRMLLRTRKAYDLTGMIHHSDKGSQYIDLEYTSLLNQNHIRISMCDEPWKNAYTERINRTIKEEYLDEWNITDYYGLKQAVKRAVSHYNHKRPHQSLKWKSPIQFEAIVENLPEEKRPITCIYKASAELSTKTNVNCKRK